MKTAQRAHDDYITSHKRRINVMTFKERRNIFDAYLIAFIQRRINIDATSWRLNDVVF